MKKIISSLIVVVCFYNVKSFYAQNISTIQESLETVEAAKYTYRQELKDFGEGLFNYTITATDKKGKETETQYNFSFSDLDVNTVRAITKKDVILVQLLVSGKQKLVQVISNGGDKINYVDKFEIIATNSENGNLLEKQIKSFIPLAVDADEKRLSLNGYQAHLNWLKENITAVELPKKQIIQKINSDKNTVGKIILEQTINAKSNSKSLLYDLNLALLNPNSVGYRISGDEFTIYAETRRSINGIRHVEDEKQKNFQRSIKLHAKSITNGKDIFKVLKATIPLAEEVFIKAQPKLTTNDAALQYLNSVIKDVKTEDESLTQNLTIKDNVAQLKLIETTPDESTTFLYHYNFGDINANNIDYDGQKDRLFATLPVKKSVNFIRTEKNADLQNYTDNLKVFFNTIEEAIIGVKALKKLAENYEKKMEGISYTATSASSAVNQIKNVLKKVKIGEDTYELFIELTDAKTNTIKLTTVFSNLKKSLETVQEVSLKDINPKNCKIVVKGKHVIAELNTKHLEKIVKTYVDGQIKPYQYKIVVEAASIEDARKIVGYVISISEKLNKLKTYPNENNYTIHHINID